MAKLEFDQLLEAGAHFGNGIHIIDLYKTIAKTEEAASALRQMAKSGKRILFVATKKQGQSIIEDCSLRINMPYVIERWPGGMLTNFPTIRKAVKKMGTIDRMIKDGTFDTLSKREKLQVTRQRAKLEKNLGSIQDLTRLPRDIDFIIPANDDSSKSIELIMNFISDSIREGLEERKVEKADASAQTEQEEQEVAGRRERKSTARRERVKKEDKDAMNAAVVGKIAKDVDVDSDSDVKSDVESED